MATLYDILNAKRVALIGSSQENDIVLADPDTSPRHCQITKIDGEKFLIVDLNSSSGTFVNNKKIDKEFISDTDFITVGNHILQIRKKILEAADATPVESEVHNISEPATSPANSDGASQSGNLSGKSNRSGEADRHKSKITVYFMSAPEDETVCQAIDKHLSTIRFNSPLPIEIFGDYKIPPGADVAQYRQKLFEADIVLALISVDFLNKEECYERGQKVMVNYNDHRTILLSILARNCMWKATPYAQVPILPRNGQPLNNKQFWNSEDDALTEVVKDISKSISELTSQGMPQKPVQHDKPMPKLTVDWQKSYLWGVFWKRVAASFLDGLIIGLPLVLLMRWAILSSSPDSYEEIFTTTILYLFLFEVLQILICAFMEASKWRGTPGKMIMKLQISDNAGNQISFGKAVWRNVVKLLISATAAFPKTIILYLIFMAAQVYYYSRTKKFFHDQLTNTVIGERLQ